jgi:hypothetical protein
LHPAIIPVKRRLMEAYAYQRVYTPRTVERLARLLA